MQVGLAHLESIAFSNIEIPASLPQRQLDPGVRSMKRILYRIYHQRAGLVGLLFGFDDALLLNPQDGRLEPLA